MFYYECKTTNRDLKKFFIYLFNPIFLALELANEDWFDEFNGNYANKAECFVNAYGSYPEV